MKKHYKDDQKSLSPFQQLNLCWTSIIDLEKMGRVFCSKHIKTAEHLEQMYLEPFYVRTMPTRKILNFFKSLEINLEEKIKDQVHDEPTSNLI